MNLANAFSFLILGSVMNVVPSLAPTLAAGGLIQGQSASVWANGTSALWLHFMGFVVGLIGSSYLVREAAARVPALVTTATARVFAPVPAAIDAAPARRSVASGSRVTA